MLVLTRNGFLEVLTRSVRSLAQLDCW